MTVRARIKTVPPSHQAKDPDRETRSIEASGDIYEDATAQLRALVPDGWRMLHLTVER